MRIAILDLYYGQSGKIGFYNIQALGLAKAYVNLGHEVYIVRPEKNIPEKDVQQFQEGIVVMTVPAKTLGVHSFYDLNFLLEYQIDLVHLNADNQAYVPAVIKFCKKHKIPFYNYIGTLYSDTENRIKKVLMNIFTERNIRYYKKSNTFVKTAFVLEQMKKKGVSNAKVVSVGLDLDVIPEVLGTKKELREELGLPANKKILLFVGRLSEYKKPMDALEVLEKLSDDYFMIIIGNGELKSSLLDRISSLKCGRRVKYIEAVPNVDIHKYYKAADCFVNFNPKEIFGMSLLESAYQECPIVAKHAPGPDTIVEDSETGYLCHTLDEMCKKVQCITPSMGIKAKCRVEKYFTWMAAGRAFLEGIE